MRRTSLNRRTAEILRKTIQQLEADPTIDTGDQSFVSLKCALLSRILDVEAGSVRDESRIHLVRRETFDRGGAEFAEKDSDSAIA